MHHVFGFASAFRPSLSQAPSTKSQRGGDAFFIELDNYVDVAVKRLKEAKDVIDDVERRLRVKPHSS